MEWILEETKSVNSFLNFFVALLDSFAKFTRPHMEWPLLKAMRWPL